MDRKLSHVSYVLQQNNLWSNVNLCVYCLLEFSEEHLQGVSPSPYDGDTVPINLKLGTR